MRYSLKTMSENVLPIANFAKLIFVRPQLRELTHDGGYRKDQLTEDAVLSRPRLALDVLRSKENK